MHGGCSGRCQARALAAACPDAVSYSLNQTAGFILPGVASSFLFLANTAPRALATLPARHGAGAVEKGDVLHFEALAQFSQGARRLGVLKADVDTLSLLIQEGLNDERARGLRPTITRMATMSSMLDLFFAGHVRRICLDYFQGRPGWQKKEAEIPIDGLFYVVYSGGDDLFIVGPWDAVLRLTLSLRQDFTRFTGRNPNLRLFRLVTSR